MTEDERDTEAIRMAEALAREMPKRCHAAGMTPVHSCMALTLGYVGAMHGLGMDREAMVFGVRNAPDPDPEMFGACIGRKEDKGGA